METEIEAVIKYFKNGGQLHYYGSEFKAAKIADLLPEYQYLYSGDAPDMFFKKDDLVIIIEHFEFDCYKATQKGSDFRRELARIQRNEEAVPSTEEGEVLRDVIHGSSSYEYYISNVTKAFKEHYAHIDLYIDNLRKSGAIDKNSHIKVLFFIEDVSPLGCVAVERTNSESELVLVTLAESREFLDLLRDNTRVDFVLACSSYSNEPYIWFIDRTELDAYYEQALDYHSMRFAEFTPRVRVFKKLITIDETGEIRGN